MASAMSDNILASATEAGIEDCVDNLRYRRDVLGRMLADSKHGALSMLLLALAKNNLLEKSDIPGLMASNLTHEEKCLKFFTYLEESILKIPELKKRQNYVVGVLRTLLDLDHEYVALSIHPQLTSAILKDKEDSYSADIHSPDLARGNALSSEHTPRLRESASYPGAASGDSLNSAGLQQSTSQGFGLDNSQAPLNIRVRYNNKIHGPQDGEDSDEEIYRNCSSPRGLVFLADYSFKNSRTNHEPRQGSHIDVRNLKELFEQMGYHVPHVYVDLDKKDTLAALRKFREDSQHEDVHSCIVVIMSHGKGDGFITDDGLIIKTRDVQDLFNNLNCPALMSKLKLFIFQFCRGVLWDGGVAGNPSKLSLTKVSLNIQTDSAKKGSTDSLENLPTHSDQFCLYPCIEGYVSLRDPDRGTWLIEALCKVFMNHACDKDLNKLVQLVSKEIINNESSSGMKQSCENRCMGIIKSFYFNPVDLKNENRFLDMSELSSALRRSPESATSIPTSPYYSPRPEINYELPQSNVVMRQKKSRSRRTSGSPVPGPTPPVSFANELFPPGADKRGSADLQFLQPSALGHDDPVEFVNSYCPALYSPDLSNPADIVDSPVNRGRVVSNVTQGLNVAPSAAPGFSAYGDYQGAAGGTLYDEHPSLSGQVAGAGVDETNDVPVHRQVRYKHRQRSMEPLGAAAGELTYQEYRRQKSLDAGLGRCYDVTALKRLLSTESVGEPLKQLNKLKSQITDNARDE
ncbi:uncharacterized protein LOC108665303 [Hyalella azteca]|uniref:Uncharacterized protein LOC108665303 n=1 Tax=Hyalella azteca TaxID=294128 RepID=A0A8B7N1U1_HYAAZ|nr:uncharacterized protein LOC108665303 [Hyalella azteca]